MIRLCKLLFLSALAPGVVSASIAKDYSFNPGDISMVEESQGERRYWLVGLEGLSNTARDIGLPWLPFKDVIFIIPPDVTVERVRITSLDSVVIKSPLLPLPMQYPATSQGRNPFVYETADYYAFQSPGTPVELLRHGVSADANLAVIRLFPVQFCPRTLAIKLYTRIGIALETTPTSRRTMSVARDSLGRVDRISFIEHLVENPQDVRGFLEQAWQGSAVYSALSREKMAIVTAPEFLPAFDRLASWKTEKGCSTGVYTVDKIGASPAELLGFIRDKVSSGCEYVLLGGGEGVIPIRTSCYQEPFGGASFTDLYYADCSNEASSSIWDAWNENHNQYYGEPYANHIIVKGISFADRDLGWIAGNGRSMGGPVVVKTVDGGKTWSECAFLEFGLAYDLAFVDSQEGFVAGNFGIARSVDGGVSWELVWNDDTSSFQVSDIDFYEDEMWAVGLKDNNPLFVRSADGGLTWNEVELGEKELYQGSVFIKVDVISHSRGWIVGSNTIQRVEIDTVTGEFSFAEEWRGVYQPAVSFWGCGFFDEERGSVYGYGDLRFRLYTRSATGDWTETTPDTADAYFNLSDLSVSDEPAGRIFAFGYNAYLSDDYGMHWTPMAGLSMPSSPRSTFLKSDPRFVWAAGEYKGDGKNLILKSSSADQSQPSWDSAKTEIIVGDEGVDEWMPDVAIGRLPVVNLGEAQIAVDKIIDYEKNPPPKDFAERALFMSANMESYKDDFSCLKAVSAAASSWTSGSSREAWRLFNPLSGEGFSGDELNNSLNATENFESGYNFICHVDHGTAAQFGTGYKIPGLAPYNRLFSSDIAALDNKEGFAGHSIVYSAACAVAQYTREVDPSNPVFGGNIAVEFLRNPHGGAVTFIGGVEDVDRGGGNSLTTEFVKALLADSSVATGWALVTALEKVSSQSLAYNMHLLGDPSLYMYNAPVNSFSAKLDWTLDSRGFEVTLLDAAGRTVSGADACLYMQRDVYRVTRSNDQGEARFPSFEPPAGVLMLTVTAPNFIPYQEVIATGEVSSNPLAVGTMYPEARIAVDLEGNLHLVYTDSLYGRRVARYAFSADTGRTWSLSSVDATETRSTFAAGITLVNELDPCVAYLVKRGADSTTLKFVHLKSARRFVVADLCQKTAGCVSVAAELPGIVHIAVRTLPKLRYYKVDLSTGNVLENKYHPIPGEDSGSLVSGSSLILFDSEPSSPSEPLVFADTRTTQDSSSIYAWFPLRSGEPFLVTDGEKPSAAAAGRSFTLAYLEDSASRVRSGYLAQTGALHFGSKVKLSDSAFTGIAALGTSGFVLTGQGAWVAYDSALLGVAASPAFSPQASLDFESGVAAALWHEQGFIHVSAAGLDRFPAGHEGAFPPVSVCAPAMSEMWPMETVRPVVWCQTVESDSVAIELSTDSAQTFTRIAARGWREPGLHYFHWEVGRLADRSQIPEPEDSYPFSFIRVICGADTALSPRFAVGGEYAEASFAAGSDPADGRFYADSQVTTGWMFVGRYGCELAELELSLDAGETFVKVAEGASQAFWALPSYQGSITWQVPDTVCDSACLRLLVRDTLGDASVCLSGIFSIARPYVPPPIELSLSEPVPNPFSDVVEITYSLPLSLVVNLKIYDITGRLVSKLVDGEVTSGVHTLRWEGRDDANRRCAAGVYFVRFETDDFVATKKMVLLK